MGLFDFLKKPKTDLEEYYEQREVREQRESVVGDFSFVVEDVFSITGRGTVVTGQISSGSVRIGDRVVLERTNGTTTTVEVSGLEMFRKLLNEAVAGQNVGILLKGVSRNDIGQGDKLRKTYDF